MTDTTFVHINRARHSRFGAHVRKRGYQKFECIYSGKSRAKAFRVLAEAMASRQYKRGVVTGFQEWYGHDKIAEMVMP